MRLGTMKSRAPSGVDLVRIGVSTSMKPRCSSDLRKRCVTRSRSCERREHLGAADVEVAPLQARELVGVDAGLDLERRRLGAVEHLGLADDDLDLARGHVRVVGAGRTAAHDAGEQHDPLGPDLLGGDERRRRTCPGSKVHCTMPVRSRRSMKIRPPWSRRLPTHPASLTTSPTSSADREPHMWERIE